MTPADGVVADTFIHLSAAGVSLVLDVTEQRLPSIVHWGADLGAQTIDDVAALALAGVEPSSGNVVDGAVRVAVVPEHHAGWEGKPGIVGHRDGTAWSPRFAVHRIELDGATVGGGLIEAGAALVAVHAHDPVAGLSLTLELELLESGLLRARADLRNDVARVYTVGDVNLAFPVPVRAREVLDFAGRWSRERVPQRHDLVVGIHEREGRKGRTGPDAATVLSVGTRGFEFSSGEVWGVHVGFSGNHRHYVEQLSTGSPVIGGGELLLPGEVRLAQGESYRSPWVYAAYGDGLDAQAHRFHRFLRARASHPTRPRPVTLNVWEAVYFDHDVLRLLDLADRAAALGVERFVLDDGWFLGRRDDTIGLGDWTVDRDVWPDGLGPLVERVTALGMEFGLWFEPEMVNEESELARAHPEWMMQTGGRLPIRGRNQQVLNLGIPAAFEHVLADMTAILEAHDIAYIKWDHNRDLIDAGTAPSGAAGVHEQTLAAYRLMDELKRRFPDLEIESCSSGGARVDLGVIERTDRVWVSDCIDPLERQQMMRWTMQLMPAELLGSHIGATVNHTTGRTHELSFRAATALFGHFGIEWDLAKATARESADLAAWIDVYKAHRGLLHSGDMMRADTIDPAVQVTGAIAQDRSEALVFLAFLDRPTVSPRGRFTIPGLDPDRRYRVAPVSVGTPDDGRADPAWYGDDGSGVVLSGRALASAGVHLPGSFPEHVVIYRITTE
ncbi:alpha-galactosidase [Microbacterium hydrocarbonoxydans]|uniref:alpha-galactosidase n=1 Tax=Microbacterium hydrocarbonoxydans TaxID=273678 RepID=UPI00203C67A6|nr:alpha-galactosidase [Microbacterium hydrocarbonoxydans]MCM3778341.1 alpha-galactosidase [Microbacterium hydrocarbonoxydans]